MKKLDKMAWEHRVFERMDVFLTKDGNESIVFLREWTYFDKMWACEQLFLRENLEKLKKMIWEHGVFERMDVFLTKYGHKKSLFLENR